MMGVMGAAGGAFASGAAWLWIAGAAVAVLGVLLWRTMRRGRAARAALERFSRELDASRMELEDLLFAVSHDLRAPLRRLQGCAEVLGEEAGPALGGEAARSLEVVQRSTRKLSLQIEGLLRLSRVAQHRLQRRRVDSAAVVDELWRELSPPGPDGAASRYRLEVQPGMPHVDADPSLFRQLWAALIENAVKFSAVAEQPIVRISAFEENGRAWFRIEDNGAGFDLEDAGRLFKPLQRLHAETEFPGVGIGLAIVQAAARKHGGEVRAGAGNGRGARFEFTLDAPPG
jgi:signal transduction histidine kinase